MNAILWTLAIVGAAAIVSVIIIVAAIIRDVDKNGWNR